MVPGAMRRIVEAFQLGCTTLLDIVRLRLFPAMSQVRRVSAEQLRGRKDHILVPSGRAALAAQRLGLARIQLRSLYKSFFPSDTICQTAVETVSRFSY